VQRRVQILGWTLIWSAVLIFGYLGWQLFGTDLLNAGVQAEAQDALVASLPGRAQDPAEEIDVSEFLGEEAPEEQLPEPIEFHPEEPPEPGGELAFIRIPDIELDAVVFEGVDTETLRKGPGHMPGTPIPGQPGNAVVSGHRTTYGRPFFDLDQLAVGDRIEVETAIGTHVYHVREMVTVLPSDVWVTEPRPGGWLTLTTCNPKFSARERLIVWAEMVSGPNIEFVELHKQRFG
jgi:sortase A